MSIFECYLIIRCDNYRLIRRQYNSICVNLVHEFNQILIIVPITLKEQSTGHINNIQTLQLSFPAIDECATSSSTRYY